MGLHTAFLAFVVDVALGTWLGVMAFFSFVGAPRAFAVLGDDAAAYVNDVFPRYFHIGVGLGALAFFAGLGLAGRVGLDAATLVILAATAVATLLAAYSRVSLIPNMAAAGDEGFERYHRRSVILNGVALLAVSLALAASHLPG